MGGVTRLPGIRRIEPLQSIVQEMVDEAVPAINALRSTFSTNSMEQE